MVEYKDMHWEGDNLFYGKKDTTVKIVKDENFRDFYWVEWSFEIPMISERAYNITRAKDNARNLYTRYRNTRGENGSE